MYAVSISQAKAHLSKLIEELLAGKEIVITIVITRAGKSIAKLVPFERDTSPRDLSQGTWEGKVWMANDFDELPEELARAFGMIE